MCQLRSIEPEEATEQARQQAAVGEHDVEVFLDVAGRRALTVRNMR